MKSFAPLSGKLSFFISTLLLTALLSYSPVTKAEWTNQYTAWSGLLAASIVGVAQLEDSEVIFSSLYGIGSFYMMHQRLDNEEAPLEDFILPTGLLTMSLLNATLLKSDEESPSTIIFYNFLGAGGLVAYWYFFEELDHQWVILPDVKPEYSGLLAQFRY